ncbi:hypothetical protein BKA65DRAFT_89565 [Rhexocercosporidium sp. MPI-PUGE-AT-0058]|nr:hypothetical protein BKA65DRAFT_89565 [Rhexocercosporidium sp. MPI-PUGE-AT-0058]
MLSSWCDWERCDRRVLRFGILRLLPKLALRGNGGIEPEAEREESREEDPVKVQVELEAGSGGDGWLRCEMWKGDGRAPLVALEGRGRVKLVVSRCASERQPRQDLGLGWTERPCPRRTLSITMANHPINQLQFVNEAQHYTTPKAIQTCCSLSDTKSLGQDASNRRKGALLDLVERSFPVYCNRQCRRRAIQQLTADWNEGSGRRRRGEEELTGTCKPAAQEEAPNP